MTDETAQTRAAALERQQCVAVRRAVVQHDVGEVGEPVPGRVPRSDPGAVLDRGDRDQRVAVLPDQRRQLDHRAVDAGLGGDHEHVLALRRREGVELVRHRRVALQLGVGEHVAGRVAVQHEIVQGESVGGDQATGAGHQLGGEGLGVAGAEGLEHPASAQPGGDQVGRPVHPVRLRVDQPVEHRADGVRVPLGTDHEGVPFAALCPSTAWAVRRKAAWARSWVRCATAM